MDKSAEGEGSNAEPAAMAEQQFLDWLRRHGAGIDSIDWPSSETGSGIRGAVAKQDIEGGEHMVVIPRDLMMSESHAKADPQFGHVHRLHDRLLGSDNGLAVYVMQEILKGDRSFYRPYLRVLPTPRNLQNWDEEDLLPLQDRKLVRRTASRKRQLQALYQETIGFLSSNYPDLYAAERYTFELFAFAWSTVQARAFGKRLKSSALVPFADCLNHGNVQTKYDFDVGGNGVFRLFPTGANRYPRYSEVLNSYGRRANETLLLDYGFAMLDNEWDTAEVVCSLSSFDYDGERSALDKRRTACLRASGQHTVRIFRLRRSVWDLEMLRFCRCACLTAAELDRLEAAEVRQATTAPQSSPADSLKQQDSNVVRGEEIESAPRALCRCYPHRLRKEAGRQDNVDDGGGSGNSVGSESGAPRSAAVANAAARPHLSPCGEVCHRRRNSDAFTILPQDRNEGGERERDAEGSADERREDQGAETGGRGGRLGEGGVGGAETGSPNAGSSAAGEYACRFPCKAMSAQNEIAALRHITYCLIQARKRFPTTLEHDENAYRNAQAAPDASVELLNALIYRVTVKRIIAKQLEMAKVAVTLLQDVRCRERTRLSADRGNDPATKTDWKSAAPSSLSLLDQMLPFSPSCPEARLVSKVHDSGSCGGSGGGGVDHQQHQQGHSHEQRCSTTAGPPSFDSYLSDLDSAFHFRRQNQHQHQHNQHQQSKFWLSAAGAMSDAASFPL
ncbi:unnamed protein product [Scytosiphon promiscuus]